MSLQLIAKQMEAKGRNGDSVLVHMTTGEVAGLQKLAENAGGSLSVNPETGLVEASFLKSILPTLVGAGVSFMTANPYLGVAAGAAVGGYQARRSGQDVGMGAITGGLGGYGGFQLASGAGLGKAAGQALTGKQMFQSGLMALAPSLNVPMPQQQSPYPLMSADINQSSIPFQNIQAYAPPMPRYTGGAGNVYIPQFRGAEGGTVKMAEGGAFEDLLAYEGVMPNYMYQGKNIYTQAPVRQPRQVRAPAIPFMAPVQVPVQAPVQAPTVVQPMMETGRGDGYAPNADFVTPEQQAAFYRDNPTMAGITQFAQRYNPFASLQEYFDPGFIERQGVIAAGLNPNQSFNVNGKVSGFNYDGDYDSFSRDRVSPGSGYVGGTDINSAEMGPGISSGSGYVGGTQINDAEMAGIADAGTVIGGLRDAQQMAEIGNGVTVGGPASAADLKGESIDSPGNDGASEGRSSGGNSGGADGSNAAGGLLGLAKGGMKQGGFVVPADVVSMVGEGNTDAGYRRIMALLPGATPIKGKDGGQSDTVKTNIEGKQPARVAHGEMYIPPEVVNKAGGAKKLYAMMDKVRQQATGSKKQIKPVRLERAMA